MSDSPSVDFILYGYNFHFLTHEFSNFLLNIALRTKFSLIMDTRYAYLSLKPNLFSCKLFQTNDVKDQIYRDSTLGVIHKPCEYKRK